MNCERQSISECFKFGYSTLFPVSADDLLKIILKIWTVVENLQRNIYVLKSRSLALFWLDSRNAFAWNHGLINIPSS